MLPKLRARRIGVDQVLAAIRNDNIDAPVSNITIGQNDKSVGSTPVSKRVSVSRIWWWHGAMACRCGWATSRPSSMAAKNRPALPADRRRACDQP